MKRGLVFCGGGSLGAYEAGVYKYLKEIDYQYDIVTGTSIGSLNGALAALKDYETMKTLWTEVEVNKVMKDGVNFDSTIFDEVSLKRDSKFRKFVRTYANLGGADISPLKKLVTKYLDVEKLQKSEIQFACVVTSFPLFKEEDIIVSEIDKEYVIDYLLASCSCYPIFPIYTINGKQYIDGGYRNNMPIDLALKMGADEILAVQLNFVGKPQHYHLVDLPFVRVIMPTWPLGSMMSFTNTNLNFSFELGYLDALKFFEVKDGIKYAFEKEKLSKEKENDFCKELTLNYLYVPNKIKELLYVEIDRKYLSRDYYIRALEILAEKLQFSPTIIYTFDDLFNKIDEKIVAISRIEHVSEFIINEGDNVINSNKLEYLLPYLRSVVISNDVEKTNKTKELLKDNILYFVIFLLLDYNKKAILKKVKL